MKNKKYKIKNNRLTVRIEFNKLLTINNQVE